MSTAYSRALDGNKNWRYRVVDLFVMIKGEKRHLYGLMDALDCVTKLFQVEFAPFNKSKLTAQALSAYTPSEIPECKCIAKPLSRDNPKQILKSAGPLTDITNTHVSDSKTVVELQAPCSVLKAPNAEKHSVQTMIDELFDPPHPPRPLATCSTKRSMSAMIDELFDPPPPPRPSVPMANINSSTAKSHTTGSHKSHFWFEH
jgi:hypothetical protein